MAETLIIGLGGAGTYVCRRLHERLLPEFTGPANTEQARVRPPSFLVMDTDRSTGIQTGERTLLLTASPAVLDTAYRSPERFHAEWADPEVLRGRSSLENGTGGSRMLGRFLLLLPENRAEIRDRVRRWIEAGGDANVRRRVFVVASACGGTGGGMLADLGYLLHQTASELGVRLEQRALLFVPPTTDAALAPNTFATLTELHYFSDPYTRYFAHLTDEEAPFETRRAPYHRVSLLTSVTAEREDVPLRELQERAVIYLMTDAAGDTGTWEGERTDRESKVPLVDSEGNPQVFGTFGTEWVEYPEERLVNAVYRNLIRRSLISWLQGDQPIQLSDVRSNVPMRYPEALARLVTGVAEGEAPEAILTPIRIRLPWIHKAPISQWMVMDQEMEALLAEAVGSPPSPGRPGKGPFADRARRLREQAVEELRARARQILSVENVGLEKVSRVLGEAAAEVRTATDPHGDWEAARDAFRIAKGRALGTVNFMRKDPFLLFWRGMALRKLALEYERIASTYVGRCMQAETIPFLRELRMHIVEPVRIWAGRVGEIQALFAGLSRAWADQEAAYLERLRQDESDRRLALGRMHLPGAETPYVANSGWQLPYCRPEEEFAAITALRRGWIELLVTAEDGLFANPGCSALDGAADDTRENRTPWLMPATLAPVAAEGSASRMREVVNRIDAELRNRVEDQMRSWLSATAFHRMAEQYRDPVDLEFHLRRLVATAAELPALEPPHARPSGFPSEYEVLFFGEAKEGDLPSAVGIVVEEANRERPTRLIPSRSTHYLTAITEHAGFPLTRCPDYHRLTEAVGAVAPTTSVPARGKAPAPARAKIPFSRTDIPWRSATLMTRARLRDASDVLFLALAFGILRALPTGNVPIPVTLLPLEGEERRFPLPAEFDLGVRQLAGEQVALDAVSLAVDRAVQSKGVEWCALQIERALQNTNQLGVRFPGIDPAQQGRSQRLAAIRAVARYDELQSEFAGTAVARETDWLRAGAVYRCPACGQELGADVAALPGACPRCREVLLLPKVVAGPSADGFRRIPNPYVVGTPLESGASVFVGREDIIQQVRERLIRPASRTILILIGERRCGKTSALKQLQYRLEGDLTPVFVDLQGLTATDLSGFVWWLAWRIKEALDERGTQIDLPTFAEFSSGPADYQFETVILPEIRKKLGGGRVLLMLDEFEVLAQRVMKGTFDSRAFDYLRHLMQHSEGIEFLFSGTHILRQFAANYVTFLFNIGVFLAVDFLRPQDALRLIQEPVAASGVTFAPDALDAVLELAGSHAYFTQMFGFHLVERLNRVRKRTVTREDVEAESGPVIGAASAHLDHLWGQLESPDRLLIAYFVEFCARGQKCTENDLLQAAAKDDGTVRPFVFRSSVEKLNAVGLMRVETENGEDGRPVRMLSLTAEVYRRWLQTAHPYSRLKEEGLSWE